MAEPRCPNCGGDRVETTLHLVFRRAGNTVFPQQDAFECETICNDCGAVFHDERAEALLRARYPEFWPEPEPEEEP